MTAISHIYIYATATLLMHLNRCNFRPTGPFGTTLRAGCVIHGAVGPIPHLSGIWGGQWWLIWAICWLFNAPHQIFGTTRAPRWTSRSQVRLGFSGAPRWKQVRPGQLGRAPASQGAPRPARARFEFPRRALAYQGRTLVHPGAPRGHRCALGFQVRLDGKQVHPGQLGRAPAS